MSRNAQGAFSASKLHRSCSHACEASAHGQDGDHTVKLLLLPSI